MFAFRVGFCTNLKLRFSKPKILDNQQLLPYHLRHLNPDLFSSLRTGLRRRSTTVSVREVFSYLSQSLLITTTYLHCAPFHRSVRNQLLGSVQRGRQNRKSRRSPPCCSSHTIFLATFPSRYATVRTRVILSADV